MPIVNVQMLAGRTARERDDLIRAVSDAIVGVLAVSEDAVRIILTDVAPENWAVGSRSMAARRSEQAPAPPAD